MLLLSGTERALLCCIGFGYFLYAYGHSFLCHISKTPFKNSTALKISKVIKKNWRKINILNLFWNCFSLRRLLIFSKQFSKSLKFGNFTFYGLETTLNAVKHFKNAL